EPGRRGIASCRPSKPHRHLRRDQLLALLKAAVLAAEAVLELGLQVAVEALAERAVDAPDVAIPRDLASAAIVDLREELLVPAHRHEELGSELVLGFEIIGHAAVFWKYGVSRTRIWPRMWSWISQ